MTSLGAAVLNQPREEIKLPPAVSVYASYDDRRAYQDGVTLTRRERNRGLSPDSLRVRAENERVMDAVVDLLYRRLASLSRRYGANPRIVVGADSAPVVLLRGAHNQIFGMAVASLYETSAHYPVLELRLVHAVSARRGWLLPGSQRLMAMSEATVKFYASRPGNHRFLLRDLVDRLRALVSGDACDCARCGPRFSVPGRR